ncbi:GATA zinc finger domain-containing protein 4-like [Leptopilina boulardi]|uniref:GATA zinc finger domain-containing protein 4-like n=1 Tax=Leptopilina boulardi TaxID=63433 RepID=UPI0021F57A53|nr:GATA zinc finger domain-containing protein 4-like [Leptopilina boulardi]
MTDREGNGERRQSGNENQGHIDNPFAENRRENFNATNVAELYRDRTDLGFQSILPLQRPFVANDEENAGIAAARSIADSLTIQNALMEIKVYDGKNMSVKDFIQDVVVAASKFPPEYEGTLITSVLGKLTGPARDCTDNKQFARLTDIIELLKERFAPGQAFEVYYAEIMNLKMYRNENLPDLYDRLLRLLSGASSALRATFDANTEAVTTNVVKHTALKTFVRALPDEIANAVDARAPRNLEEAYKYAKAAQERKMQPITGGYSSYITNYNDNSQRVMKTRWEEQNDFKGYRNYDERRDKNRYNTGNRSSRGRYQDSENYQPRYEQREERNYNINYGENNYGKTQDDNTGRSNDYNDPRLYNPNADRNNWENRYQSPSRYIQENCYNTNGPRENWENRYPTDYANKERNNYSNSRTASVERNNSNSPLNWELARREDATMGSDNQMRPTTVWFQETPSP